MEEGKVVGIWKGEWGVGRKDEERGRIGEMIKLEERMDYGGL